MSKRPLTASTPAEPGDRVRLTAEFERTQLLGILFGEFDRNLVAIENCLGVYISARGNRVQIEGEAEAAARARDVLTDLYDRIEKGQEVDAGMVRSEEHTSELQSLMRISYAVFCLKKQKKQHTV